MSVSEVKASMARKRKILIVDDNEINREIMVELLSDEYDCLEAENGEVGLEMLYNSNNEIAAVLLDLMMPVCSGTEFLQRTSKDPELSSLPIIVMTAETAESVQRECLALGATEFLSKNANPVLMKARLKNIIRLKESAALLGEIETDELTGIYTRQAFYYFAKKKLEENPDTAYDLLMVDIEDFKIINNIYGEEKGDALLKSLAGFIRDYAADGVYARYDSDRFVCLAPASATFSSELLENKMSGFEKDLYHNRVVLKCGIYEKVDRTIPVRIMCDRAALALNSIKADYSRKFSFYDGPVSKKQLREKKYALDFKEAIAQKEFIMWYQPKINPNTGIIAAAEALVRWRKPDGSLVPPYEFISVFEDNGLIVELDEYVFRTVCSQQKNWLSRGLHVVPVSINLSRRSMARQDLIPVYKGIVEETGVPIDIVPIEVTESAAVRSVEIQPIVEKLHEAGFAVHLDDFGSGQSSVNALSILQPDVVKIDKSLVDNIGEPRGNIILETITDLAVKLKICIVAEGVEDKEQLDFLRVHKVDEIQGYYYSKPLPVDQFEAFVKENLAKGKAQQ